MASRGPSVASMGLLMTTGRRIYIYIYIYFQRLEYNVWTKSLMSTDHGKAFLGTPRHFRLAIETSTDILVAVAFSKLEMSNF